MYIPPLLIQGVVPVLSTQWAVSDTKLCQGLEVRLAVHIIINPPLVQSMPKRKTVKIEQKLPKEPCFLRLFQILFNLDWILGVQLAKVVFSLVFPIFWHPWHPWSRIKQTILINETISCNLAHCAAMSGRKLEAPDGHHREKKSRLRGLLACTQGVLPSKYVLSLTMYGRWLLCHGLFLWPFSTPTRPLPLD